MKHLDEIPDSCLEMFSYPRLTELDPTEVEDGWETRTEGIYMSVYICIYNIHIYYISIIFVFHF